MPRKTKAPPVHAPGSFTNNTWDKTLCDRYTDGSTQLAGQDTGVTCPDCLNEIAHLAAKPIALERQNS